MSIDFAMIARGAIGLANDTGNDYLEYEYRGPFGYREGPPKVAVIQYKMNGDEAMALTRAIEGLSKLAPGGGPPAQACAAILKEIHALQAGDGIEFREESLALDEAAADCLTEFARRMGCDLKFSSGQREPRPTQPMG